MIILLASGEFSNFVTELWRLFFGLICCFGVLVLGAFIFGFSAEQGSGLSTIFRCSQTHPQHGRCALGPRHWGHPHRGRNGRSWY